MKKETEWADGSWNPVTGCSKISAGCKNCYAEAFSKRLHGWGQEKYKNGFQVTLHPKELQVPARWKKPRLMFVCSMSDLFHDDVPDDFIQEVFRAMSDAKQHTFQVLTKRSPRMVEMVKNGKIKWPANVWAGVTVEHQATASRINDLTGTGAILNFVSIEPMIGPVALSEWLNEERKAIDWVIVGGESGAAARPIEKQWVRNVRDQCIESKTPFFFKQWGGTQRGKRGYLLDGKKWLQYPDAINNK